MAVTVTLRRIDVVTFEATNEKDGKCLIQGAPKLREQVMERMADSETWPDTTPRMESDGMRPMELFLASIGGCAAMDFVLILTRQRQDLRQLVIRLEGERADATPAPFERVHLQFTAYGTIEPNKLQRAAELAVRKYCSVASTLNERVELQIETQLAE